MGSSGLLAKATCRGKHLEVVLQWGQPAREFFRSWLHRLFRSARAMQHGTVARNSLAIKRDIHLRRRDRNENAEDGGYSYDSS
jgi:hypothetical protein